MFVTRTVGTSETGGGRLRRRDGGGAGGRALLEADRRGRAALDRRAGEQEADLAVPVRLEHQPVAARRSLARDLIKTDAKPCARGHRRAQQPGRQFLRHRARRYRAPAGCKLIGRYRATRAPALLDRPTRFASALRIRLSAALSKRERGTRVCADEPGRLEFHALVLILARDPFPPGRRHRYRSRPRAAGAAAAPAFARGAARRAGAGAARGHSASWRRACRDRSPPRHEHVQRLQQILDVVRRARARLVHRLQVARLAQLLLAQLRDVELAEQLVREGAGAIAARHSAGSARRRAAPARRWRTRRAAACARRTRRAVSPARQAMPATAGRRASAVTASSRKRAGAASARRSSASTCSQRSTGSPIEKQIAREKHAQAAPRARIPGEPDEEHRRGVMNTV